MAVSYATMNPPACYATEKVANAIAPALLGYYSGSEERRDDLLAARLRELYNQLHHGCNWRAHQRASTGEVTDSASMFIGGLYDFAIDGKAQEGSVEIMRYVDSLLHAGDLPTCNHLLETVQIDRLPTRMVLAFVTITRFIPVDDLSCKPKFISRVRERLDQEIGPDRTNAILGDA
jgi:hypothetical protein